MIATIDSKKLLPGQIFATETGLSDEYGVTLSAIRQAIDLLVEKGFVYRMSGRGVFVAYPYRTIPIVIVMPNYQKNRGFSFATFVEGLDTTNQFDSSQLGRSYPLIVKRSDFESLRGDVVEAFRNAAGVIFYADVEPYLATRSLLTAHGIPAIFYGADTDVNEYAELNAIVYPQAEMLEIAMTHLISQGYKKISFVGARKEPREARRASLFVNNWMSSPELQTSLYILDDRFEESLEKMVLDIPIENWPEAFITSDDQLAIRLMNVLYRIGLSVPHDVALMGMSGLVQTEGAVCPISTVRIPYAEDAKRCAERIFYLGSHITENFRARSTLQLVARRSTDPFAPHYKQKVLKASLEKELENCEASIPM